MRLSYKTVLLTLICMLPTVFPCLAAGKSAEFANGYVRTSDGVRIHYLEAGEGPSVLFVPGWTMPAWIWEHQIRYFSKTHRVIAMDPRSQGESDRTDQGHYPAALASDIKAVVDSLDLAPVVLVAWSMAVTEAVAYVDQYGTDSLAGLVLVDGTAGYEFDMKITRQMLNAASNFQKNRRQAAESFTRGMFKNPAVLKDQAYLTRVLEASLQTPTNSAIALFFSSFATDNRPALAKIDVPTLIVVADSPWMPFYREFHAGIPGSQFVVLEDAGHALFVDEPEVFNELVRKFIQGIPE